MKKDRLSIYSLIVSLMLGCAAVSCSSDDPEEPKPKPENPNPGPEKPDPTPETPDSDIKAYFTAVIQEKDLPDLGDEQIIQLADYEKKKDEIWKIWRDVCLTAEQNQLPNPVALNDLNNTNPTATGSWGMGSETLKFVYGSKGTKPSTGWPLFLSLHGSGDAADEWSANLAWAQYYKDAPVLYFIPRSPQGGTGCRWYQPSRQKTWERLFRQAHVSGTIDPNKIYITGISEGAYGTERLSAFYADYLAGAGPVAGGEPFYNRAPENTANLFYFQRTGALDSSYGRAIIVGKAQKEWAALKAAHPGYYNHKIELEPNKGHSCNYDGITAELKKHNRNPWPKYVYWENFGMGNVNGESFRTRSGFYNLHVVKGQNGNTDGKERDAYEMKIDGNNIDLKIMSVNVEPSDFVTMEFWQMNTGAVRTKKDATTGTVRIYLNNELVDLTKPVTVTVNGTKKFEGMVKLDVRVMVQSLGEFFDSKRIFPAEVTVSL